jgi:hypothetical protein
MKRVFHLLSAAGVAAIILGAVPTGAVAGEKKVQPKKQIVAAGEVSSAKIDRDGVKIGPGSYNVRTGSWERPWPFGPDIDD